MCVCACARTRVSECYKVPVFIKTCHSTCIYEGGGVCVCMQVSESVSVTKESQLKLQCKVKNEHEKIS